MESTSSGIVHPPINLIVWSASTLEDLQTEVASSTYDFTSSRKSAEKRFDYYMGFVLFQIIKMFPKMKVDERNAALKVMLVRSLSHPCLY